MLAHGRETVSARCLETPAHQAALSRFHHLQPRVELMSAGSAADDIRLNHEFVGSTPMPPQSGHRARWIFWSSTVSYCAPRRQ